MVYSNNFGQVRVGVRTNSNTIPIDADATAFIAAAGITDLTQASAINTLVNDLKTYGIWSKMKALYPFVGGSAASHKWNLKDPRDLDAAFRLQFNGGWTHTSTGALPNGTTGYANTFLIPSSTLTNYSSHLSFYSRTNRGSSRQAASIGSYLSPNEISLRFNFTTSGSSMSAQYDGYGLDFATYTTSTTNYFLIGNRTANNINKIYENGILKSTNTITTTKVLPSSRVLIGALSDGNTNVIWYDNLESTFASIGDGLSDTESTNFYNAVQKFNTTLGRQIGSPVLSSGQSANLLETYSGSEAAYSLRKLRAGYYGSAIRVRRSLDNQETNIGFDANGNLDLTSLLSFTNPVDTTKLLDSYGSASAAYSLRKLSSSYTGSAIRVRRSSDNTEQDIAFNAGGDLNTVALLSFVGSGNGFVTTWYDQSGNGRNVTQTTPDNQPIIVNAGVIHTLLGKPSLYFDGTNDCLDRTDTGMPTLGTTVLHVSRYTSGSVDQGMIVNWGSGASGQAFYNMYWSTGMALSNYGQAFNVSGRLGVDNLTVITKPNSTGNQIWKIYVNSSLSNTSNMTTSTTLMNAAGGFRIGRVNPSQAATHAMLGYISELVVWPSDMDSQRNSLASNVNSYYSVYNSTLNAFVTTWYDQSGRNRNLVQVNSANQPQIAMNGIVFTEKGKPTVSSTGAVVMSMSAGNTISVTTAISTFMLLRTNIIKSNSNSGMFLGLIGGAHLAPSRNSLGTNRYYGTNDITYAALPTGNNYITITNNSNKVDAWENGTQVINTVNSASDSVLQTAGINLFDRWLNSAPLTLGTGISELIVYNSDQRTNRSPIESSMNSYFNVSYTDTDAQTFITNAGITNDVQQSAIITLVKMLKNEGLWTKMKAIYPFVGGTATTHKFNLKDPRDTNDAFRLLFYGGLSHDGGGVFFNGSNSWCDTNMNAATNLTVDNLHLSFYSRTNANNTYSGGEIGHVGYNSWTTPPQDPLKQFTLRVRNSQYTGSNAQFTSGNLTSSYSTIDGFGLTIGSITTSATSKMFRGRNSSEFATRATSTGTNTGTLPSFNISLGKTQGYGEWSTQQAAFVSIGDGLTDSESAKLYGIVQIYQITLGRSV